MPQPRSSRRSGSRQIDLFPRSKRPIIPLADDHPLVVLADTVEWTEMEARAQQIRSKKLKNAAGRPPHFELRSGRWRSWPSADRLCRFRCARGEACEAAAALEGVLVLNLPRAKSWRSWRCSTVCAPCSRGLDA